MSLDQVFATIRVVLVQCILVRVNNSDLTAWISADEFVRVATVASTDVEKMCLVRIWDVAFNNI